MTIAYGGVRAAQIVLFLLASRVDDGLRHSVVGLAASTGLGVAVLVAGATLDGDARLAVWALALLFDMAGPLFIDTNGWRLVPHHFAERHGLIIIVALGESIVDVGVIAAAVLGMAVACAFWWAYFDVVAVAATRRLAEIEPVQERNELARDAYSYVHLPMVAAVVLVALGMKTTLAQVGDALSWETATALVGGAALYLLAQTAFRWRTLRVFSIQRVFGTAVLVACIPLARQVDSLVTVALVGAVLWALLIFEAIRFASSREEIRHPVR